MDVAYHSIEGAGGKFFRCEAYRATLSTAACARRWKEAQATAGHEAYRFNACRACAIGAAHAGESLVRYSALYGSSICSRCGRGSTRLVWGEVCPSDANRQYEWIKGRNAKGSKPRMADLERRSIRFAVVGGAIKTHAAQHSADTEELMVNVLRRTRGQVVFGFHGRAPGIRQGFLF
jgi:hypothetical protein